MSETHEETPDLVAEIAGVSSNGTASAEQALFDQLRARRDEVAEKKSVDVPLQAFEEFGLHARYRLMSREEVAEIGDRVVKQTKDRADRMMMLMVDTLVYALDGFMVKEKGKVDLAPLSSPEGQPVRSWGELVHHMGGDARDEREAVYWIFGHNEFAIGQQGMLLNRWMGNTSMDVEAELGEVL